MARTAIIPKKILSLLEKNHLLSASQMIEEFEKTGESYNKTSVYRALEKLLEQGKICRENFSESEAVYELRSDHHDHAVCTNCETVQAVPCVQHSKRKVAGFQVDHHHTTLYGLCDNCAHK